MITLDYRDAHPGTKDERRAAGQDAEQHMAHYLNRAFEKSDDVALLHGLRLVDETRRDVDGGPVVAQMDHLVLHRFGAFIVESKSLKGLVRVRPSPSGGGEWSHQPPSAKAPKGINSPIEQGIRQAEVLRGVLINNKCDLLGKMLGMKQKGFDYMPIQVIVAFGSEATIDREGWNAPEKPFRCAVEKADNVCAVIKQELKRHKRGNRMFAMNPRNDYGLWTMGPDEFERVGAFLLEQHRPRKGPAPTKQRSSTPLGSEAKCKECGSTKDLKGLSGPFGPYWKCLVCGANTKMPRICSACGCDEKDAVRVRQRKGEFVRCCGACGVDEVIAQAAEG